MIMSCRIFEPLHSSILLKTFKVTWFVKQMLYFWYSGVKTWLFFYFYWKHSWRFGFTLSIFLELGGFKWTSWTYIWYKSCNIHGNINRFWQFPLWNRNRKPFLVYLDFFFTKFLTVKRILKHKLYFIFLI